MRKETRKVRTKRGVKISIGSITIVNKVALKSHIQIGSPCRQTTSLNCCIGETHHIPRQRAKTTLVV